MIMRKMPGMNPVISPMRADATPTTTKLAIKRSTNLNLISPSVFEEKPPDVSLRMSEGWLACSIKDLRQTRRNLTSELTGRGDEQQPSPHRTS